MKKFLTIAAVAFAAFATVSCDKENGTENGGENNAPVKKVLTALASKVNEQGEMTSGRAFVYNEDGKLAQVNECWVDNKETGELGWYNLNVEWTETGLILKDAESGNAEYTWTLNAKGYITQSIKGNSTYKYEYDADDHLVKVYESYKGAEFELVSVCTWENGNMTSWSKEKYNDDGSARVKQQTYKNEPNTAGIFTCFTEKGGTSKWMFELGFFGKPSVNLVATDKWADSDTGAEFEFRTDDDDYVIAEIKYYGGELDDEKYFIWK